MPKTSKPAATDAVPVWQTALVVLLRVLVGGVFAFSGFVKAVDPWGGYYKITEYLGVLGWTEVAGLALFASVALAAVEFVFGVLLLVGAYRRGVPLLLTLLMLLLTSLTLWLALTDAVADCGCFGDAVHLSNWSTFGKNLLLLAGLLVIWWNGRRVRGWYGPAVQWIVGALSMAVALVVAYYGYFTQPLIDFRPYPVGTRLAEAGQAPSDDDFVFIYEKDGRQQEFALDSLPDEDAGWTYVDRRPAAPQHGTVVERSGHQLALLDEGDDVTAETLGQGDVLLMLFADLPEVSIAHTFVINELADYARTHDAAVVGVASATQAQVAAWRDISMADYPMLAADDSDVKMVARGNPAVAFVSQGVLRWKRTLGSISADRIHDPALQPATLSDDFDPEATLRAILTPYAIAMVLLLVVNRLHLLIVSLFARRHDNDGDSGNGPAPHSAQLEGEDASSETYENNQQHV